MHCACTWDADGAIVQLCDAHVAEACARELRAREAERAACAGIADAWGLMMTGGGLAATGRSVAEGIAIEIRARR
jgi:hypothetical protein